MWSGVGEGRGRARAMAGPAGHGHGWLLVCLLPSRPTAKPARPRPGPCPTAPLVHAGPSRPSRGGAARGLLPRAVLGTRWIHLGNPRGSRGPPRACVRPARQGRRDRGRRRYSRGVPAPREAMVPWVSPGSPASPSTPPNAPLRYHPSSRSWPSWPCLQCEIVREFL